MNAQLHSSTAYKYHVFFFFFAMLGVGRGTELIRADFFFLECIRTSLNGK